MTRTKLVEIVWNDEKAGFVRTDNNRKVRTAIPIGPLTSDSVTYNCNPKTNIEDLAKKYGTTGTIGYETVQTARDVGGGEFNMGDDVYAFRLYKIN